MSGELQKLAREMYGDLMSVGGQRVMHVASLAAMAFIFGLAVYGLQSGSGALPRWSLWVMLLGSMLGAATYGLVMYERWYLQNKYGGPKKGGPKKGGASGGSGGGASSGNGGAAGDLVSGSLGFF